MADANVARRTPVGLGHLGLRELLEPQLRSLVAEHLAVPESWLRPEISLAQDLAADPLDCTEIVIAAERRFGVSIPEATIDELGTYGDFVDAVIDALLARDVGIVPTVFLRATIVPGPRGGCGTVTRSAWLYPYAVETIMADARRAGPGARLEIVVPATAPFAAIDRVRICFEPLATADVTVDVQHARSNPRRAVA